MSASSLARTSASVSEFLSVTSWSKASVTSAQADFTLLRASMAGCFSIESAWSDQLLTAASAIFFQVVCWVRSPYSEVCLNSAVVEYVLYEPPPP